MHAAHTPRILVVGAGLTYVAVFAAFVPLEEPGLGIGHFYYVAIALVALGLGPIWGATAGVLATALYATGIALNHAIPTSDLYAISTPIRLVTYVAIAARSAPTRTSRASVATSSPC